MDRLGGRVGSPGGVGRSSFWVGCGAVGGAIQSMCYCERIGAGL